VTDLYEWHEVAAFLRSDASTLKGWYQAAKAAPVPHNVTTQHHPALIRKGPANA
jgi:hypothetical protein